MVLAQVATAADSGADPWKFEPHVEVWMLVAAVIAMGVYVARVIGPKMVPAGEPAVTAKQKAWFAAGVIMLWAASDWPIHDIGEQYLYSVHMLQHLMLTFFVPPMFWLAMPEWLAHLLVPQGGWASRLLKRVSAPITAGVVFNALVVFTHWSIVVNTSVRVGAVHYLVHLVMVTAAFVMWLPVCSPWKDLRLSPMGQCIYLFMMSIIPTVPGAWLSLSESPVYEVYDHGERLFGLSVVEDQTIAGLFMKVAGGAYLWAVIVTVFFRWGLAEEKLNRRAAVVPPVEPPVEPPVPVG